MNGRIYDPLLGRMLSADLLVPNPNSLQSFNRYSYVGNNPLSTTDPTGFESDAERKAREDAEEAKHQQQNRKAEQGIYGSNFNTRPGMGNGDNSSSTTSSSVSTVAADSAQPVASPAVQTANSAAPQTALAPQVQQSPPSSSGTGTAQAQTSTSPATPPPPPGRRPGDWKVISPAESKKLLANLQGSTLVADGKGGVRAEVGLGGAHLTPTEVTFYTKAKTDHEVQGHGADALASNPDIAKGLQDGQIIAINRSVSDWKAALGSTEVRAATIELNEYQAAKQNGTFTGHEEKTLDANIAAMKQYIQTNNNLIPRPGP